MDEIIQEILHVDSWQGVVVIVAGFAYLAWRDYRSTKKVETVKTQVEETNAGVGAVLHQVENNSGTSLKDAVDRIEPAVTEMTAKLDAHLEVAEAESKIIAQLAERYLDVP